LKGERIVMSEMSRGEPTVVANGPPVQPRLPRRVRAPCTPFRACRSGSGVLFAIRGDEAKHVEYLSTTKANSK
jgi:hypothetical protein